MERDDLRRAGKAIRERLDQHADSLDALGGAHTAPGFAQMISEAVYGGIWSRPGLGLTERMICTLAVMGLRAP